MRSLESNPNIDNSDLVNYPNGRIKDNTGIGDGTAVNERVKGDLHQAVEKLMRLYGITPNNLPDNETNGFQIIDALRALASKNDFILNLGSTGGVLQVSIKLGSMVNEESVICVATADFTTETQIKGSDAPTFAATIQGGFKTGEYVRLIKKSGGITLVRIADQMSLDLMVAGFLYLKKASQSEENAGTSDLVATTPLVNKTTFARRVNGVDSATYLATALINGLYPKEHFSIVAALGASPVKNTGWFSGLDVAGSAGSLPVSGNVTSAVASIPSAGNSVVLVTLQNAMTNTNYYVEIYMQSEGLIGPDNDICAPVFKVMSTTQIQIGFQETLGGVQNLKVHIKAVQL